MADAQPPITPGPAPIVPSKRPHDDEHAPSISSPLNPNPTRPNAVPAREPRSKKESLKKREASGTMTKSGTPETAPQKKQKGNNAEAVVLSPIRYNHPLPRDALHYIAKEPEYASYESTPVATDQGLELKRPLDHAENRKNYRYNQCVADPSFTHSRFYRHIDEKPFGPRMSFSDSDKWFHFDPASACFMTNEKGWRMGRANVVAREGSFYYEVRIVKGVPPGDSPTSIQASASGPLPHIRMGWARREAPLDAPVGFDGYSYGLTDTRLEPMHKSRAHKFLDDGDDRSAAKRAKAKKGSSKATRPGNGAASNSGPAGSFSSGDHARTGDIIGLSITLPPLALHRKVADGTYNPAVDASTTNAGEPASNIVRDRFPVPYKGAMYFETIEYRASKGMDGYGDRGPFVKESPSTNHADPSLRSLPGSSIKIWKNGKRVGTAFRNLMAFLPPCSQPGNERGVRMGQDDGMVGYYPAISAFSGGIAEVNFGPNFWFKPEELEDADESESRAEPVVAKSDIKQEEAGEDTLMADAPATSVEDGKSKDTAAPAEKYLQPMSQRFSEQIAEDVVCDIIDEVDFFVQDGGVADFDADGLIKTEHADT